MIRVDRVDLVISIYCKKEKPKHVYLELPVWVPNGSERVSIYHPLGFKEGTLWKVLVNIYIYINMYDVCPDVQIPPEKVFRVFFGCPTNFSGGVWMSRVYIYIVYKRIWQLYGRINIYKCKYIYIHIYLIIFAKSSKYLTQTYINIWLKCKMSISNMNTKMTKTNMKNADMKHGIWDRRKILAKETAQHRLRNEEIP